MCCAPMLGCQEIQESSPRWWGGAVRRRDARAHRQDLPTLVGIGRVRAMLSPLRTAVALIDAEDMSRRHVGEAGELGPRETARPRWNARAVRSGLCRSCRRTGDPSGRPLLIPRRFADGRSVHWPCSG